MPYVGNKPEVGNFRKCDAITTSATATYNLLVGGVAVNPNQNQCIVSLNGVIQSSGDSYTIASSQITFASALTSSDVIDFILILGDTLDVGVPSDDTCSQAKIQNEAINEAKMQISNAGTNGQYLQKQSGNTGGLTWADAGGAADDYFASSGLSAKDLGSGLHIKTGDSGASAYASADELIIESDNHCGINILTGTDKTAGIAFGDSGDNNIGYIDYDNNSNFLAFGANAAERMRITSGGQIGIMNSSPGTAALNVQQNSDQLYYGKNGAGTGQFQVTSAGVISAQNTTVQSISDERLKKDIADFSGGLDIVKAMRPRTYKWKNPQYHNDKDDTQYGFVAQELLTISDAEKLNLVVVDDANTMMYENEKDLLPDGKANISGYQEKDAIYVSAIKELLTKIETLETKVTALENK